MSGTLTKLAGADLATVTGRAGLPPDAKASLRDCVTVADALDRLEAAGKETDAVRILAYALPRREAVWWACVCAANTAPSDLADVDRQARETAELWVRQQKDDQRRAAFAHAEVSGFQTPEAWSGVAAFWSGDSMAPLGQAPVPPGPELTGTAVAGAVALASLRGDTTLQKIRLKRFLESGRNIASGGPGRIPPENP